jgi:hypothetical protein
MNLKIDASTRLITKRDALRGHYCREIKAAFFVYKNTA